MIDPRQQFGPTAQNYLTSAVHSNEKALQRLVEVVRPNGGTVLDVATGAGHTAYIFAPWVDHVIASDITENMLRLTRSEAEKRDISNLSVLFAKAEDLPLRHASLEGITCRMGAHHFESVQAYIEESKRALKPGGWFLLVDTIGSEDPDADEQLHELESLRDPSHVRNYPPSKWRAMLESNGLSIRHEELSKKRIYLEDWMERMRVPDSDCQTLRHIVAEATGEFRGYLQPGEEGDLAYFYLGEILLFATVA